MRFASLWGGASASILNVDELFVGGLCDRCGSPAGPRTAAPLRLEYDHKREIGYHGVSARNRDEFYSPDRRPFVLSASLYSHAFVDGVEAISPGSLAWRPSEVVGNAKHDLYELVGSKVHVPYRRLRNDKLELFHCDRCKWREMPRYPLVEMLPDAVLAMVTGKPQMRPNAYIRSFDAAYGGPDVITAGDWYTSVGPILAEDVWSKLARSKNSRFVTGVLSEIVESVGNDLLIGD